MQVVRSMLMLSTTALSIQHLINTTPPSYNSYIIDSCLRNLSRTYQPFPNTERLISVYSMTYPKKWILPRESICTKCMIVLVRVY